MSASPPQQRNSKATAARPRPAAAAPPPKRGRTNKVYMVSSRFGVARDWIEHHFQLPATASDEEVQRRADMLRHTMVDGDVYDWAELQEYVELGQHWPALYKRWVANKDHADGTEWAVFDVAGKIEFVRTESAPFPNRYSQGRVADPPASPSVTEVESKQPSALLQGDDPLAAQLPPLVLPEPTDDHVSVANHITRQCGPENRECLMHALVEAMVPWIRQVHPILRAQPADECVGGWQYDLSDAQLRVVDRWFSGGARRWATPPLVTYSIPEPSLEDEDDNEARGMLQFVWCCGNDECVDPDSCTERVTFMVDGDEVEQNNDGW
jgi:hypothetical protein